MKKEPLWIIFVLAITTFSLSLVTLDRDCYQEGAVVPLPVGRSFVVDGQTVVKGDRQFILRAKKEAGWVSATRETTQSAFSVRILSRGSTWVADSPTTVKVISGSMTVISPDESVVRGVIILCGLLLGWGGLSLQRKKTG